MENSISSSDNNSSDDERKQSPPAFLDLADSAGRLGSNITDLSARVELKRLEHERQRTLQRKYFEDQMRMLEVQQAQELLNIPYDPNAGGMQHLAVSAPTTPPRVPSPLSGRSQLDPESLSKAVGTADKRKSVTYAPSVNLSPDINSSAVSGKGVGRAGAKSMPASRRTSASSHDEDLAGHLHGLSLIGERTNRSPVPVPVTASILTRNSRYEDDGTRYNNAYNAGMMLDEQLDEEMHNAMLNLPTSDDDKFHNTYPAKISTSSAALDLAHASQTSPRPSFTTRNPDSRDSPSEWPQFSPGTRGPDAFSAHSRRVVTNPAHSLPGAVNDLSKISSKMGTVSASATPLVIQHPQAGQASRRSSPSGIMEGLSATRSVPATPLGVPANSGHLHGGIGTPHTGDPQGMNGRLSAHTPLGHGEAVSASDLQASLSRLPTSGHYENAAMGLNPMQHLDESLIPYGVESVYGLNGMDSGRYASGFESSARNAAMTNNTSGSTALYHHNGTRYGLGIPGRVPAVASDGKMNGLHGPKHKRGDVDTNRYAGTRLEDLQGEIVALCKDQHGCRYLQKKLEEGIPDHRDLIFRETFGHFADLMTDPFGNYLCQKLLEYSTDEQRNVICESVAQDLVTISLNMHGTRAVQKMIDFLSTRRQVDPRYNAQIHSIILALSLHVVILIKDLNGNHVIQKCLNKLSPEDNQFIFNAVAANCVEVATHRHGCCVLQRCIDHASEHQRVQLVNEITGNALTLVQDPYGNYVVQYILDLNDNRFSDAVVRQFIGNICALSVQKFSSNVIEKCIRVAEHTTRKQMIDELLNRTRLEKLLRDSYGNYCVQTALDYAEPAQRAALVEGIRPVLPLIRNTPYGKRIQNKLQRENLDFGGGYSPQPVLINGGLSSQAIHAAGRHMSNTHLHQGAHLSDLYAQNGMYSLQHGQGSFNQAHLTPQLHSLQPQSLDSYGLQGSSNLGTGLSGAHSAFSGGSYNNHYGGGIHAAALNDPYQRSFAYGM